MGGHALVTGEESRPVSGSFLIRVKVEVAPLGAAPATPRPRHPACCEPGFFTPRRCA